jgi:hypothetical protein
MNKAMIKKLIIEAYLSGAESMYCGCYERPTKAEAREWYDQEYGVDEVEDCECCEEDE